MKQFSNTRFEQFTKAVYERIAFHEGVKTKTLDYNRKLLGKNGQKHQVDVYWEYEDKGRVRRLIIECKNYSRKVSKDKVEALAGLLSDFSDAQGILVSANGFQKGAVTFAANHGIKLVELSSPQPEEVGLLEITVTTEVKSYRKLFRVDEDWAKRNGYDIERDLRLMLPGPEKDDNTGIIYNHLDPIEDSVKNSKGEVIASLKHIEREAENNRHINPYFVFFDDAYVQTKGWRIKIKEIRYKTTTTRHTSTLTYDLSELVIALVKEVSEQQTFFI